MEENVMRDVMRAEEDELSYHMCIMHDDDVCYDLDDNE